MEGHISSGMKVTEMFGAISITIREVVTMVQVDICMMTEGLDQ